MWPLQVPDLKKNYCYLHIKTKSSPYFTSSISNLLRAGIWHLE